MAPILALLLLVLAGCGGTPSRATPEPSPTPTGGSSAGPARLTTARCAGVVVLGLRGQGQSARTHQGVGHEVQVAFRALVARLRETTVRLQAVRHPATLAPTQAAYDADIATGERMLDRATAALASCPRTRVVVVAFSEGAQVAHRVAERRDYPLVVLVGDPLRNPRHHDVRTLSFGTRLDGRGNAGYGAAFRAPEHVVEACVAGDNVCNAPLGGRVGGVSVTHKTFYEKPSSAAAVGRAAAAVLTRR